MALGLKFGNDGSSFTLLKILSNWFLNELKLKFPFLILLGRELKRSGALTANDRSTIDLTRPVADVSIEGRIQDNPLRSLYLVLILKRSSLKLVLCI